MIKRLLAILLTLILVFTCACGSSVEQGQKTNDEKQEESYEDQHKEQDEDPYVEYSFRSDKLLTEHYNKHGIEMGFEDKESYQKAASDVINNKEALSKREKEDNDYVFYIEDTNEFVILSEDGYIRTYFLPSAGKSYYDRQ